MNGDGSGVRRLTEDPASDESPEWSPDGKTIAFVSDRDGGHEVFAMSADGSDPHALTQGPDDNDPVWSPDGSSSPSSVSRRERRRSTS